MDAEIKFNYSKTRLKSVYKLIWIYIQIYFIF